MRIIVTGHLGYIGHHLVKELYKFGEVVGIDIKEGNDILDCDLPEADLVIHLAAQPAVLSSIEYPTETVKTNLLGTVRLAEKYKNTKFIFASTGGAIQDTIPSPYGLSKYCAEMFVKMLFNDYVILRFANVYGLDGSRSVIDKFIKEDIIIFGDGEQSRTFVHIDDLIEGIIQSIGWDKGEYSFGSEQNHTVLEIAKATGKPYTFIPFKEGELMHSRVANTTPNWKPKINIMDYIK